MEPTNSITYYALIILYSPHQGTNLAKPNPTLPKDSSLHSGWQITVPCMSNIGIICQRCLAFSFVAQIALPLFRFYVSLFLGLCLTSF